ncbi:MAG: PBECR2 nuclease fold domain-containing protein [Patescibacteria group bacterium]
MSVRNLFKRYIEKSKYKKNVVIYRAYVCTPRKEIQDIVSKENQKMVFISTKSLKHIYDRHVYEKKKPKDFYFLIKNIEKIIGRPDRIYKNKPNKRGDFIFVKEMANQTYMCTLEIVNKTELDIVSAYITGEKYLSKFTLLWS